MAVTRLDEAGVDVIKVMATGGNLTPGSAPHESQFGLAELRSVVEAAHAAGLPVAAHAHGTQGVSDALDARVDTIEHCSFMTADGVAEDATLVRRLASSAASPSRSPAARSRGPIPPAIAVRMRAWRAWARTGAGVRCIIATDAGICQADDVLTRTVEHAVEDLGATVDEALAMCTARAAEGIGLGHKVGRLRPGAAADLLVVSVVASTTTRQPCAIRSGFCTGGSPSRRKDAQWPGPVTILARSDSCAPPLRARVAQASSMSRARVSTCSRLIVSLTRARMIVTSWAFGGSV